RMFRSTANRLPDWRKEPLLHRPCPLVQRQSTSPEERSWRVDWPSCHNERVLEQLAQDQCHLSWIFPLGLKAKPDMRSRLRSKGAFDLPWFQRLNRHSVDFKKVISPAHPLR